jgi:hypothetical protein
MPRRCSDTSGGPASVRTALGAQHRVGQPGQLITVGRQAGKELSPNRDGTARDST